VLQAAGCKYRTQKIAKNRHVGTIAQICRPVSSQLRHVSTIGQNVLNSNISSTSRNIMNNGPIAAEIDWRVWDSPANFNGFRVLASLLQRRHSTEANQTARCLAISWARTHFGGSCPLREFFQLQSSHCVHVLRSRILAALLHALEQRASAKLCAVVEDTELLNFR